jgi:hypothetical protein
MPTLTLEAAAAPFPRKCEPTPWHRGCGRTIEAFEEHFVIRPPNLRRTIRICRDCARWEAMEAKPPTR